MKAMTPTNYWALAFHLQKCGHHVRLLEAPDGRVKVRLSSGDYLHDADLTHHFTFLSRADAIAHMKAWDITEYFVETVTV